MDGNGYQDISALLRSLTSHTPAYLQPPRQEGQETPSLSQPYHPTFLLQPLEDARDDTAQKLIQENQRVHHDDESSRAETPYLERHRAVETEPSDQYNIHVETAHQNQAQEPLSSARPSSGADPRTIITWPMALRHVTALLARNPSISGTIKKMIANQHENERSWWAGRQALLRQQGDRKSGQKQLDDVLRSVGALPSSGPELMDPVAELKRYDTKVHAAATKMADTMSTELKTMGVPFFGVNAALIAEPAPYDPERQHIDEDGGSEPTAPSASGKVSPRELAALQGKMVTFLEDYCKD